MCTNPLFPIVYSQTWRVTLKCSTKVIQILSSVTDFQLILTTVRFAKDKEGQEDYELQPVPKTNPV